MRLSLALMACAALLVTAVPAVRAGPPKPKAKTAKSKMPAKGKWVTTKSGLKYKDTKVGKGPSPKVTQWVTVKYVGKFKNGEVFDASERHGGPAQFPLNRVIPAWTEGVSTMKVGGKRSLIAPPNLAYGAAGRPGIPPNSTLYFDVELLKISDTEQ